LKDSHHFLINEIIDRGGFLLEILINFAEGKVIISFMLSILIAATIKE
jgi:hypothetical protein